MCRGNRAIGSESVLSDFVEDLRRSQTFIEANWSAYLQKVLSASEDQPAVCGEPLHRWRAPVGDGRQPRHRPAVIGDLERLTFGDALQVAAQILANLADADLLVSHSENVS